MRKNKKYVREMCDTIISAKICVKEIPKQKKRKVQKKVFTEIMAKNFPNLI